MSTCRGGWQNKQESDGEGGKEVSDGCEVGAKAVDFCVRVREMVEDWMR